MTNNDSIKISFIFTCRLEDGREGLLSRYFESLIEHCDNPRNIEVIIKFDDDQDISEAKKVIDHFADRITIKHVVTPRGQGYKHLCYFYTELLFLVDTNSQLISVHSIDLVFTKKGFDTILLEAAKKSDDGIFVLHAISNLSFIYDIKSVNDAIQRPDNFPLWSRRWIEIQGHFGYNSSTDGWSQLTEFFLFTEHGIDRRVDLTGHNLFKEMDNVDRGVNSKYWEIKRREAMEHHLSQQNIELAQQNARNLALNINSSFLPNCRNASYNQNLIDAVLDSYDSAMRTTEKEMESLRLQIKEAGSLNAQLLENEKLKNTSSNTGEGSKIRLKLRKINLISVAALLLALIALTTQLFFRYDFNSSFNYQPISGTK